LDYVTPEYEEKCHPLGSDFWLNYLKIQRACSSVKHINV
jgi:hypothetical protein